MKRLFQYPRTNWKETDQKKLFLARLKGDPLNFGRITIEERMDFLNFATEAGILKFIGSQEYRSILSQYEILEDFGCIFDRASGDLTHGPAKHWLSLNKGDFLEFTESIMERSQNRLGQSKKTHVIYMDVSDIERNIIYEM